MVSCRLALMSACSGLSIYRLSSSASYLWTSSWMSFLIQEGMRDGSYRQVFSCSSNFSRVSVQVQPGQWQYISQAQMNQATTLLVIGSLVLTGWRHSGQELFLGSQSFRQGWQQVWPQGSTMGWRSTSEQMVHEKCLESMAMSLKRRRRGGGGGAREALARLAGILYIIGHWQGLVFLKQARLWMRLICLVCCLSAQEVNSLFLSTLMLSMPYSNLFSMKSSTFSSYRLQASCSFQFFSSKLQDWAEIQSQKQTWLSSRVGSLWERESMQAFLIWKNQSTSIFWKYSSIWVQKCLTSWRQVVTLWAWPYTPMTNPRMLFSCRLRAKVMQPSCFWVLSISKASWSILLAIISRMTLLYIVSSEHQTYSKKAQALSTLLLFYSTRSKLLWSKFLMRCCTERGAAGSKVIQETAESTRLWHSVFSMQPEQKASTNREDKKVFLQSLTSYRLMAESSFFNWESRKNWLYRFYFSLLKAYTMAYCLLVLQNSCSSSLYRNMNSWGVNSPFSTKDRNLETMPFRNQACPLKARVIPSREEVTQMEKMLSRRVASEKFSWAMWLMQMTSSLLRAQWRAERPAWAEDSLRLTIWRGSWNWVTLRCHILRESLKKSRVGTSLTMRLSQQRGWFFWSWGILAMEEGMNLLEVGTVKSTVWSSLSCTWIGFCMIQQSRWNRLCQLYTNLLLSQKQSCCRCFLNSKRLLPSVYWALSLSNDQRSSNTQMGKNLAQLQSWQKMSQRGQFQKLDRIQSMSQFFWPNLNQALASYLRLSQSSLSRSSLEIQVRQSYSVYRMCSMFLQPWAVSLNSRATIILSSNVSATQQSKAQMQSCSLRYRRKLFSELLFKNSNMQARLLLTQALFWKGTSKKALSTFTYFLATYLTTYQKSRKSLLLGVNQLTFRFIFLIQPKRGATFSQRYQGDYREITTNFIMLAEQYLLKKATSSFQRLISECRGSLRRVSLLPVKNLLQGWCLLMSSFRAQYQARGQVLILLRCSLSTVLISRRMSSCLSWGERKKLPKMSRHSSRPSSVTWKLNSCSRAEVLELDEPWYLETHSDRARREGYLSEPANSMCSRRWARPWMRLGLAMEPMLTLRPT